MIYSILTLYFLGLLIYNLFVKDLPVDFDENTPMTAQEIIDFVVPIAAIGVINAINLIYTIIKASL